MTGNIAYLSDFKEFNGGYVTFKGGAHGGKISIKGIDQGLGSTSGIRACALRNFNLEVKVLAPMMFSDSEVTNDKSCTKTCLKNYETLKKQCDNLIVKLNQTEFTSATYKKGLATVEEQLFTYKKNEVLFSKEVAVLKREVACKDFEINVLKSEFEKFKQEKKGIEFIIQKFDNASKSLDKLTGSQITKNSKKGLGYHAVPPPYPLIFNGPTKLDLFYSGLDEFKEPEFKGYGLRD
nr:hypothetical protein [Tanacetum cinerariifolium]